MAEPTHDTTTGNSPNAPGWCDWHKGPSQTAVLVDAIERSSASPIPLFACAPCREQRSLTPLAARQ